MTEQQSNEILKNFVNTICENGVVYSMESKDAFALCGSNQFSTDSGEPVTVFCFWSDEDLAKSCCIEDWYDFKVNEVSITSFIEDWCVGIYNDSFLVGLDFNKEMFGLEVDPIDLILNITKKLKSQKIDLDFEQFKNIQDIENQIKKMFG